MYPSPTYSPGQLIFSSVSRLEVHHTTCTRHPCAIQPVSIWRARPRNSSSGHMFDFSKLFEWVLIIARQPRFIRIRKPLSQTPYIKTGYKTSAMPHRIGSFPSNMIVSDQARASGSHKFALAALYPSLRRLLLETLSMFNVESSISQVVLKPLIGKLSISCQ